MEKPDIALVIATLREWYVDWQTPAVTIIAECGRDPFKVLVSCIISLRTKDEVTARSSQRLFERAGTPAEMLH